MIVPQMITKINEQRSTLSKTKSILDLVCKVGLITIQESSCPCPEISQMLSFPMTTIQERRIRKLLIPNTKVGI